MPFPKPLPRTKTHVRCGTPDCDWGTPLPDFSEEQMDRCRDEFREHCIKRHAWIPTTPHESVGSIWRRSH